VDRERGEYRFKAGEAMKVMLAPDSLAFPNGIYRIDEQGYADLPILGLLQVSGLSSVELEQRFRTAYINYLPQPNIQVRPLYRLSLVGGFQTPGLYYVSPRASLWEALKLAGGPLRDDGFRKMRWERNGKVLQKDLAALAGSGNSLMVQGFESGDQITLTTIERREFWTAFSDDVLPVLSFTITAVTSALTIWFIAQED
jgi:polysaccharide export outer membrane protein